MAPAAAAEITTGYHQFDIDEIELSGLNPRTHWNDADDQELQASIRAEGVLEPILVRLHPTKLGRVQVVAGERRYKAAKAVGLGQIPAIVKDVTDEKLLELALTENIQRRSMHPLDEANGFVKRLEMGHSSPEQLAAALGLSPRYVRDRIRLKKLSARAVKMLEAGDMTVSHAIILARLDPKQQDLAIEECTDYQFGYEDDKSREVLEPVGALKQWISENVPLDPQSPDAQEEFPELAEAVTEAATKGATVVMLSSNQTPWKHKATPDDPLFADKWVRTKKTDKAAQIGVIVEGRGRGERVYFKPAPPPKRATSTSSGSTSSASLSPAEKKKAEAQKKRAEADDRRRREEIVLWNKHKSQALEAYGAHIAKLPVKALLALAATKLGSGGKAATAEEFLRNVILNRAKNSTYSLDGFGWAVKGSGFNAAAWLKQQKPAATPAKAAKKAKKR